MDPVGLIVMLIILALFAGAMYVGYQKFVVEGDLFKTQETVELPTTPESSYRAPGEVPGGVAGVDNMKGRPYASAAPAGIKYYGGSDKLVPDGEAKTADVCKEFSASNGINNWGWDRINKSCFAYIDSSFLSAMTEKDNVEAPSQYIVGCTNPGVKVYEGCRDMDSGNVVWGYTSAGNTNGPGTVMSLEACRALANDEGYDAFGYRTNRHSGLNDAGGGSCFYYKDPEAGLTGWSGNLTDKAHMTTCTDPSKKVKGGCQ